MSTAPPPRRPSPSAEPSKFRSSRKAPQAGEKILVYGTGGSGKTTIAMKSPSPKIIDLNYNGSRFLTDITRVEIDGPWTWTLLLEALRSTDLWADCKTVVIDSLSEVQDLALAATFQRVALPAGVKEPYSIESYGFGKGYQYLYDTFVTIIPVLQNLVVDGKNIILIAHDQRMNVPNPSGPDWSRWEPKANVKGQGCNIVDTLKAFLDHVLYITFDVVVETTSPHASKGKAKGGMTRSIWTLDRPHAIAKTRLPNADSVYSFDSVDDLSIWEAIFGKGESK